MGSISGSDRPVLYVQICYRRPPTSGNQSSPFRLLSSLSVVYLSRADNWPPQVVATSHRYLIILQDRLSSSSELSMGYQKPGNTKQEHRRLVPASRGDQVLVSTGSVTTWLTGISWKISTVWVNVHQWLKRSSPRVYLMQLLRCAWINNVLLLIQVFIFFPYLNLMGRETIFPSRQTLCHTEFITEVNATRTRLSQCPRIVCPQITSYEESMWFQATCCLTKSSSSSHHRSSHNSLVSESSTHYLTKIRTQTAISWKKQFSSKKQSKAMFEFDL